jgi:hypothetical protein
MSTKKSEKTTGKKNGGEQHEEAATTKGRVHTIAKPGTVPATGKPTAIPEQPPIAVIAPSEGPTKPPKASKHPATDAAPAQPDDSQEVCVFAFRLLRSERDELHAATGSAKASKFVKAIVLAGARGDMKAIREIVDEMHAAR